jgi:hypothetical protein
MIVYRLLFRLRFSALAISTAAMPLAACFENGPTEAEARAAYVAFPGGGAGNDVYEEFKLAGCKEATGAPGYQCDFTYRLAIGPSHTGSGRFFKAGDKWVFQAARR